MHLSKVLYKYPKIVLIVFNSRGHKATIREETKKKKKWKRMTVDVELVITPYTYATIQVLMY